MTFLVF